MDGHKDCHQLVDVIEALRRGHSDSVGEADRLLRRLDILTGDPARSGAILRDCWTRSHETAVAGHRS